MGWYELRNHHCLIYRPVRLVDHAKSPLEADYTVTTEEEIRCRLEVEGNVVVSVGQQLVGARGTLWLPASVDIRQGYIAALYKLRTVRGVREKVTATLAASGATGDTSLTVSTCVGFDPGDDCVLVPAAGDEHAFVAAAVSSTDLELYEDQALPSAYSVGDEVVAKRLFLVDNAVLPQRGPKVVSVSQLPYWDLE